VAQPPQRLGRRLARRCLALDELAEALDRDISPSGLRASVSPSV